MHRSALYLCFSLLLLVASSAFAFPAIDLTTGDTNVAGVDGTIWSSNITQPTGTGVYNPFLRVQNGGSEEGFNTDAGPQPPLDAKAGIWTHSVQWSTLATVSIEGKDYYIFQLDANEQQNGDRSLLSLDKLQIYTDSNASRTDLNGLSALYDMDAVSDQTVFIETALKPGSGTDDLTLYIPVNDFFSSVRGTSDYMYFYTQFGLSDQNSGLASGATFEEWRAVQGPGNEVPEPSTLVLLGGGLLGLMGIRSRKK